MIDVFFSVLEADKLTHGQTPVETIVALHGIDGAQLKRRLYSAGWFCTSLTADNVGKH